MRKKRRGNTVIGLVLIVILLLASYIFLIKEKQEFFFRESPVFLDNPGRGIYVQVFTDDMDDLDHYETLEGKERLGVILLAYSLEGYEDYELIPYEKIEELRQALAYASEKGFEIIFRPAYTFDGICNDPSSIDTICRHLEQIAKVIMEFEDHILCIQAGMLGPYGEWHSSKYIESSYNQEAHKVIETWMEYTDGIEIALRRPSYIRSAIDMGADPLRLTLHNDALLSTDNDMGTYDIDQMSREEEITYIGDLPTIYMGGEMTGISDYTNIDQAVKEFSALNINYLNRYYNQAVWDMWKTQTYQGMPGDEYVIQHLGYRLSLQQVTWNDYKYFHSFDILLENTGFGKVDPSYKTYLIIEDKKERRILPLTSKKEGNYRGYLWSLIEEDTAMKMGILISKNSDEKNIYIDSIQLANNEVYFQDGINYFMNKH